MGWTERHDGASASGQTAGQIITADSVRMFVVTTDLYPDVVSSQPTAVLGGDDGATPLPGYGSAHPRTPGAFLFRYSVTGAPPNLFATAYYKFSGIVEPQDPEFFGQSGDWMEYEYDLPIARRVRRIVSLGGNLPQAREVMPFEFDSVKIKQTLRQHTMSVNIGGQIGDAITAMDDQNNKIHLLNGRPYRFQAGGYNEIRTATWVVNYQWIYDSGTLYDDSLEDLYYPASDICFPFFIIGGQPPSPEHPGARSELGQNGVKYLRLPHHKRVIVPNPDGNPESYPLFPHALPFVYEPNGWQNLVGIG